MIPEFDDNGYLPPGVHPATLEEIEQRFGSHTELRRDQMDSIRWMVDAAKKAGVLRIVINGSFVTDFAEPNDVDCVLLRRDGPLLDADAEQELIDGLPFIDMKLVKAGAFEDYVDRVYSTDRDGVPKGTVELIADEKVS